MACDHPPPKDRTRDTDHGSTSGALVQARDHKGHARRGLRFDLRSAPKPRAFGSQCRAAAVNFDGGLLSVLAGTDTLILASGSPSTALPSTHAADADPRVLVENGFPRQATVTTAAIAGTLGET